MNQQYLFKYGKRKDMERLIYSGEVYLNAASKYGERATLSKGAYDPKELKIEQKLPSGSQFECFDGMSGKSKGELGVVGTGPLTAISETDYLIFCMSTVFDKKLYDDFEADTCVVIKDPASFMEVVARAAVECLPEWGGHFNNACYYSPEKFYGWDINHSDIFFAKEDGFKHQCEFRFVCIPPNPVVKLEPVILNTGSMLPHAHMIFYQ